MYAAPAPAYYPPPAPAAGPTVINIDQHYSSGSPCVTCGIDTDVVPRKKIGCVAIAWFICLLFFCAELCLCVLPLATDKCKYTELICVKCQTIKQTIPANCC